MKRSILTQIVLPALLLVGCTHQPTLSVVEPAKGSEKDADKVRMPWHQTIATPELPEASDLEARFTCEQLDDAILKTDAVRWVMREDGANLMPDQVRVVHWIFTALTVGNPLNWFWPVVPLQMMAGGISPDREHTMLDSADRRLLSLLALKRNKACPPQPTNHKELDDLSLLADLETLTTRLEKEQINQSEAYEKRTRLLDGLRPLPAQAPLPAQSPK